MHNNAIYNINDRNNSIHIALVTSTPCIADRLLKSMKESLPSFNITASVLIFGVANAQFNTYPFCIQVDIIDVVSHYPPIYENRNRCQRHLQTKMQHHNIKLGFILDDDLIWSMPERAFIDIVHELQTQSCDIAFSSLSGDTPIPKEYTRTSTLLDVLLAIAHRDKSANAILQFVDDINITDSSDTLNNTHHDYYSYNPDNFQLVTVDITALNWVEFIQNLAKGKITTRPIQLPDSIFKATGRERGGATLILTPEVLAFKNSAMYSAPYVSRRSDMLMATDVRSAGYQMFNTPPMLEHRRDDTFDTHDVKKLIGDILGYALVETSTSIKTVTVEKKALIFKNNIITRIDKTALLLAQSTAMLRLLNHWLSVNQHISEKESQLLRAIEIENDNSASALGGLDIPQLTRDYINFTRTQGKHDQLGSTI